MENIAQPTTVPQLLPPQLDPLRTSCQDLNTDAKHDHKGKEHADCHADQCGLDWPSPCPNNQNLDQPRDEQMMMFWNTIHEADDKSDCKSQTNFDSNSHQSYPQQQNERQERLSAFYLENEFASRWNPKEGYLVRDEDSKSNDEALAALPYGPATNSCVMSFVWTKLCQCMWLFHDDEPHSPELEQLVLHTGDYPEATAISLSERKHAMEALLAPLAVVLPDVAAVSTDDDDDKDATIQSNSSQSPPSSGAISTSSWKNGSRRGRKTLSKRHPPPLWSSSNWRDRNCICPLCWSPCSSELAHNDDDDDEQQPYFHCNHCSQRLHNACIVDWWEHQNHQQCPSCQMELLSSAMILRFVQKQQQQQRQKGQHSTTAMAVRYHYLLWEIDDLSSSSSSEASQLSELGNDETDNPFHPIDNGSRYTDEDKEKDYGEVVFHRFHQNGQDVAGKEGYFDIDDDDVDSDLSDSCEFLHDDDQEAKSLPEEEEVN
ncbi:hypothetical protein ACA910_008367 [Epithemia clementina (nom. ined.)]